MNDPYLMYHIVLQTKLPNVHRAFLHDRLYVILIRNETQRKQLFNELIYIDVEFPRDLYKEGPFLLKYRNTHDKSINLKLPRYQLRLDCAGDCLNTECFVCLDVYFSELYQNHICFDSSGWTKTDEFRGNYYKAKIKNCSFINKIVENIMHYPLVRNDGSDKAIIQFVWYQLLGMLRSYKLL